MESDATPSTSTTAIATMQEVNEETSGSLQLVSVGVQIKSAMRNACTQVKPKTGTKGNCINFSIFNFTSA